MSAGFFDFHAKVTSKPEVKPVARDPDSAMTVTQVTARIDAAIKSGLPASILVRGEVTNFSRHRASGHLYFTLKDAGACISCVMFRNAAERLKFDPADGMELLATGGVRIYGQRGQYQLYVESMQPLGKGALEIAFQQLKAKLEAEGLFEAARKRRLPRYPRRLVIVTSRETAALQDMLKVLRNFPWVQVYVYHVPVQGAAAAPAIAAGLEHLNRTLQSIGGADLLLLGRGGGSLEDLWAFNDEAVARAVAAMKIPVITGIGHEVDVAISDLVADYHAHTPTEAAQVAMGNWRAVTERLSVGTERLVRAISGQVASMRQRLAGIERQELFRRPLDRVHRLQQRLDDRERAIAMVTAGRVRLLRRRVDESSQRLDRHRPSAVLARVRADIERYVMRLRVAQQRRVKLANDRLARAETILAGAHPQTMIQLQRVRLAAMTGQLHRAIAADVQRRNAAVGALEKHLHAVGPDQVLARGYSITLKRDGQVVRSKADLKVGDRLVTRLVDGEVRSTVDDPNQPSLFE